MGSGCSTADRVRRQFKGRRPRISRTKEDLVTRSLELDGEEEGTAAPSQNDSPRGLSAASTMLPGTSISLSPAVEDLPELESYRPLPELGEGARDLLMGRISTEPPEEPPADEIYFLVLANGADGYRFFADLRSAVIEPLRQLCHENDAVLESFVLGEAVPRGRGLRDVLKDFVHSLRDSRSLITLTVFGRPLTYVQPPDVIPQTDFDSVVSRVQGVDCRELIHYLYLADGNAATPCYRMQPRGPLTPQEYEERQQDVVRILESALDEAGRDTYLTSAFEDILRLFLEGKDDLLSSRSFLAHLESSTPDIGETRREDARVQHLLSGWEDRLPEEHHFNFLDGDAWEELWNGDASMSSVGGAFCSLRQKVASLVSEILEGRKNRNAQRGIHPRLRSELLQQTIEVHHHLRYFQDRPDLISSIMSYVTGTSAHPLVVHGCQGRGKSALVAVTALLCSAVFPGHALVLRFAGASPESSTLERILRSVCEQIAELYGEHPSLASRSLGEHGSLFCAFLRRACVGRPLIVLLDGLDQVEEYSSRTLQWCPLALPPHARVVLALGDGSTELQEIKELLCEHPAAFLEVPDMDLEDTVAILDRRMRGLGRRLTGTQDSFARMCVADDSYPRYAHLFAETAASWHSLAIPEPFWSRHSIADLFGAHLEDVATEVETGMVDAHLSGLLASKHGLMESEMTDVCSSLSGSDENTLDMLVVRQKLAFILRKCNRRFRTFHQLRCQHFRKLCKAYLGKDTLKASSRLLLRYFGDQERTEAVRLSHKHQRWRQLEELTHLQIKLRISVRRNFFNHEWLFQRVCSGDPYLLLEEIKMYRRRNPDDREFDVLRKFLQLSAYALRLDGRQLYAQLQGRGEKCFAEVENSIKYPSMRKLFQTSATPPVLTFQCRGSFLRSFADLQPPPQSSSPPPKSVRWLDGESKYFVTACEDEVCVWSAAQVRKMTTLKEVACVEGVVPLRRGNADVLLMHHDRIELYDLVRGALKTQMVELVDVGEGVRVLPGGKRVLAVSAAADELLLFETSTGHVVARFSTPEKRRFERPCVSGDGSVCVCGDALQKPYPLLAWGVREGALRRRFSRQHHEHVARHCRLDGTGGRLFAVAKDLLDSSPSFVLSYDVATGRRLWERRAESAVTALDLGPEDRLLVVAYADGLLCGLDAATGNTRFSNWTAYDVNCVEIRQGKSFLAWHSGSMDKSIRVFDTEEGTCVATFTADHGVVDCAPSEDGQHFAMLLEGRDTPAMLTLLNFPQ